MKFILVLPLLLILATPVFAEQKLQTLQEQSYEYQISKKDTLWGMALKVRPKKGPKVSPNQVMFAILRKNPDVFEGGNIHFLKPGSHLIIPSLPEVLAEPKDKANTFAVKHEQLRKQGRKEAPELYPIEPIEEKSSPADAKEQDEKSESKDVSDEALNKEKSAATAEVETESTEVDQPEKKKQEEEKQTSGQANTDAPEADVATEKADTSEDVAEKEEGSVVADERVETTDSFSDLTALHSEITSAVKDASEEVDYSKALKTSEKSTENEQKPAEKVESATETVASGADSDDSKAADSDTAQSNFDIGSAISEIVKSANEQEQKDGRDSFVKAQSDSAEAVKDTQALTTEATEKSDVSTDTKSSADSSGFIEITKDNKDTSATVDTDTSGFIEITKDNKDEPIISDGEIDGFIEIQKDNKDKTTTSVVGSVTSSETQTQSDASDTLVKQKIDLIVEDSLLEEEEEPSYLAWIIVALISVALIAYVYYRQIRKRRSYRDSDKVTQRRVVSKPIPKQEKIEGDDVIPTIEPVQAIVERQGVTGLSREQPVFKEDIDVKLKLALAYLETDKCDDARQLLTEVSLEGDLAQQRDAQVILARLSDAGAK